MKLTITAEAVHPDHAGMLTPTQQVAELLAAIGFTRAGSTPAAAPLPMPAPSVSSVPSAATEEPASVLQEPSVQAAVAKRERGKPAPGRKRRTAEEVAEDEAAEAAAQPAAEPPAPTEQPAISTGENRVGPEDEPEEDQIQDIADEHAEVEATKPADEPAATLEDVRAAMGAYVTAFGMPAVQADGQKIVESILGPLPADAKKPDGTPATAWAMTMFPAERYGAIISAFRTAVEQNPFQRDRVG